MVRVTACSSASQNLHVTHHLQQAVNMFWANKLISLGRGARSLIIQNNLALLVLVLRASFLDTNGLTEDRCKQWMVPSKNVPAHCVTTLRLEIVSGMA